MGDFVDEFALRWDREGRGGLWLALAFSGGVGVMEGQPPGADLDDCTGLPGYFRLVKVVEGLIYLNLGAVGAMVADDPLTFVSG